MGRTGSALLKSVMTVLSVVVSAESIVPALGNGAPRPLLQGEGVSSTAVAERKCARWQVAMHLLVHAAFVASMVRMESASLQAAALV